jgi:hypothetical protein
MAEITPKEPSAYTPEKLGEKWGVHANSIRRWFHNEPGVLHWGRQESKPGKKRRYVSLRIPAEVAERVRRRMTAME